ncbi:MAG: biotin synthase BioB [Deltaproteobacteria bacterium]|nr:biotin synthase BioB [Deltaproteobacteria bacterium]
MNSRDIFNLAHGIAAGETPDLSALVALAETPEGDALRLAAGADIIRERHFGKSVHLCTIVNAKSGNCSEDCAFCSQSAMASADISRYGLMDKDTIRQGAAYAGGSGINRYSVVTSGRRLPRAEVARVAGAFSETEAGGLGLCASLGILDAEDFALLKAAGMSRYHHNLETAKSHFNNICTTHSFEERLETLRAARAAGLSTCSGGIFGLGESDAQVLEMALTLRELDVDAVPVNFLIPIKGTRMEGAGRITPLRCIKIIALLRYVLPQKDILVCGGREANMKELAPLVFFAGASGIMTGNYLTQAGRAVEDDLSLIARLGFSVRES